jgi:hypothetical protein
MSDQYPPYDPSRPSGSYPYQQPTQNNYPPYNQPVPGGSGAYPYQPQQQEYYQQYSTPSPSQPVPSQSQPNIIVNVQQGVHQQAPMAAPLLVAVAPPTNGKATAALILGLCSLLLWALAGVPAVILGHMALSEIKESRGTQGGQGQALTGLIFGYLAVGTFAICVFCYFIGALASFGAAPQ